MPTDAGELFTIDVELLPFGQLGGNLAHPRIYELDIAAYTDLYSGYYKLDGGQTFQFRTLRLEQAQ
jgi:hypothetical protein